MQEACCDWAQHGECDKNAGFMDGSCRLACGLCTVEGHVYDCRPAASNATAIPAASEGGDKGTAAAKPKSALSAHGSGRVRDLIESVELESSHVFHAHGVVIIWAAIGSLVGAIACGTMRGLSRRSRKARRSSRWSRGGSRDANGARERPRSGRKSKKIIAV